jgi:AcrR family transcriptional regulator
VSDPPDQPSARAEQVRQTQAALVAAGRRLFGRHGFAATSVEDLARDAQVTTGALYHHFQNKTALFETVFVEVHTELLEASARGADGASSDLESLARGFEAYLDAVTEPDVQQILITDGPAVLGLARFAEMDEPFTTIVAAMRAVGTLPVADPETVTRMLLGALTRGGMLIARSADADRAAARAAVAQVMRAMLAGLAASDGSVA